MTAQNPAPESGDRSADAPGSAADGGDWTDRIRAAVRAAVAKADADTADAVWAEAAARTTPALVLYGTQNSGKTTLLRRLLVDDGTDVPDWAVVSARKETYQNAEIQSGPLRYVDTPGIGAGDDGHAARAARAVLTADALLLVLDQVPGGTAEADLLALISGEFIDPARPQPFPPGALLIALNKSDARGPAPETKAFGALGPELRKSVHDRLRAVRCPEPLPEVHFVTADPDGMTADLPVDRLSPRHYDYARAWDGIAALREALAELPSRAVELRAAAGVRYWSERGRRAVGQAQLEIGECDTVIGGGERRRQRFALLESELAALRDAAAAELRQLLADRLRTLGRTFPADATDKTLETTALEYIAHTARLWDSDWTAKLRRLAQRVDSARETVRTQPGSQAFAAYADQVAEVLGLVAAQQPAGHPAGRTDQAVWLNVMSINAALQQLELRKVEHAHQADLHAAHEQLKAFLATHRKTEPVAAPAAPAADARDGGGPDRAAGAAPDGEGYGEAGDGERSDPDQDSGTGAPDGPDGSGAPDGSYGSYGPAGADGGFGAGGGSTGVDGGPGAGGGSGLDGGPGAGGGGSGLDGALGAALPADGHHHPAVSLAGPVLQGAATIQQLWRTYQDERRGRAREADEAKLRRRVADLTESLATAAEGDWLRDADGLGKAIAAQRPPDALLAPVRARRDELASAVSRLEDLLARAPR
ncbi:GTPase domain-containing protein [Streptomyces sp. NPDC046887]|uniref:GTPase domain-containing protein n=1 Tax=Streptomyces sp. NPDC046887 TaxID=3155472 RepID=UPI0033F422A3